MARSLLLHLHLHSFRTFLGTFLGACDNILHSRAPPNVPSKFTLFTFRLCAFNRLLHVLKPPQRIFLYFLSLPHLSFCKYTHIYVFNFYFPVNSANLFKNTFMYLTLKLHKSLHGKKHLTLCNHNLWKYKSFVFLIFIRDRARPLSFVHQQSCTLKSL